MSYGVKKTVKDQGRVTTVTKPKMELRHDTSGYGKAKEKPYYIVINGKTHKRFKNKKSATNYFSSYRKKVNKEARRLMD